MTELMEIYESYCKKAADVRRKASPVAGFFGMGDDPRKHYCHEAFYDAVGEWVAEFAASCPDPVRTVAAVKWILQAPADHRHEDVYWYMYAAHGLIRPLIPLLSEGDCKALAAWYDETFRKKERLPVQQEVYKMLKKRGKA